MIINDLDGYYIVFDTKNWNTELDTLSDKLRSQLNVSAVDIRLEMRGHDFISVLYHALYKHKRISMSEEDFANSIWLCLDSQLLEAEPLFQRVLAL